MGTQLPLPAGFVLEFLHPLALLVIPLALLLLIFLRPRPREHTVGTTWPFHRWVDARPARPRRLLPWLFLSAIACALSEPRMFHRAPADGAQLPLARVLAAAAPGEPARVEVIAENPDELAVTVTLDGAEFAAAHLGGGGSAPATWQCELPPHAAGARLVVRVGATGFEFLAPGPFVRRLVEDQSDSVAIGAALEVLEAQGWIARVDDAAEEATGRAPDVRIERRSVGAQPFAPGIDAPSIRLPGRDAERTRTLPLIGEHTIDHPLLAGLEARTWSILRAESIPPADPAGVEPEAILTAEDGALIARCVDAIEFAFAPEDSDLPERAIWPVLIGRMLLELAPLVGATPAPSALTPPVRAPEFIAALLAVVCAAFWLARSAPGMLLLVLALVSAAAFVPRMRPLPPPEATSERLQFASARELIDEARALLPRGGRLGLAPGATLPLDEEALLPLLEERGTALFIDAAARAPFLQLPRRARVGEMLDVMSSRGPTADRLCILVPTSVTAQPILDALPLALASNERHSIRIHVPGEWSFILADGERRLFTARLVVEGPLPLLVAASSTGSGMRAPLPSDRILPRIWDPSRPLAAQLPAPGHGALLWDDLDPTTVGGVDLAALARWLEAGGTLLVAAAPPFHEASAAKSALLALLPAELPAPPRDEEVALGIVLVDLSGSMRRDGAFAIVAAGIRALLDGSPPGARWGVAGFRDSAFWILPPGSPIDRAALERVLAEASTVGGGTRLDRGLEFVLSEFVDAVAGGSLVIFSDGGQSGADWTAWGRRVSDAGVSLIALTVGAGDDTTLRALAGGANARHAHLRSAAEAVERLADAAPRPAGPYRSVQGPLVRALPTPALARVAAEIPAPRRRLELEPRADARVLLVDRAGAPLLLERQVGRGRTLLWLSGFDAESLPDGARAVRLGTALATILESAAGELPAERRESYFKHDAEGARWLLVERRAGEAALATARVTAGSGAEVEAVATAFTTEFHAMEIDDLTSPPTEVSFANGVRIAIAPDDRSGADALGRFAQRTRAFARRAALSTLAPLLYACAGLVALLAVVGRIAPHHTGRASTFSAPLPPRGPEDSAKPNLAE